MPIYDYNCTSCGKEFDKLLKIAESEIPLSEPCPFCSNKTVVRRLTSCNFKADVVKPKPEVTRRLREIHAHTAFSNGSESRLTDL